MTACAATQQAWFVYGLVPAEDVEAVRVATLVGILPDAAVETRTIGAAAAIASQVDPALFDARDPANLMADPDWVAARVRAYHDLCVAAAERGPFLPLAFGTLFRDLDRLRDWLIPREAAALAAWARLGQQAEWALSLVVDPAACSAWLDRHDSVLRELLAKVAGSSPGTAFLLKGRLDKARAAARAAHLADAAGRVALVLHDSGLDVRADGAAPAWTVLAPRAAPLWSGVLEPIAAALDPTGISLRLSGPWAAFAFARAAFAGLDEAESSATPEAACG